MSDISGFNLVDFFSSERSFSPHLAVQTLSSQLLFDECPKHRNHQLTLSSKIGWIDALDQDWPKF
jgi:hypothetical protein